MVDRELPWSTVNYHGYIVHGQPRSLTVDHGHWWSIVVIHGRLTDCILRFFLTEQMVSNNLSMYDTIIHLLFFDNDIISHTNYIRLWPGQGWNARSAVNVQGKLHTFIRCFVKKSFWALLK